MARTLTHRLGIAPLLALSIAASILGCSSSRQPAFPENATLEQKIEITRERLAQHTSGLRNSIAIRDIRDAFASEPTRLSSSSSGTSPAEAMRPGAG
ncbi:MAG: hypothetical protein AAGH71_06415 [Planctomycetota bacterium]